MIAKTTKRTLSVDDETWKLLKQHPESASAAVRELVKGKPLSKSSESLQGYIENKIDENIERWIKKNFFDVMARQAAIEISREWSRIPENQRLAVLTMALQAQIDKYGVSISEIRRMLNNIREDSL